MMPAESLRRALCICLIAALLLSGMGLMSQVSGAVVTDEEIVLRCGIKSFSSSNPFVADEASKKVLDLIYEGAIKKHPVTGEQIPYIAVGTANTTMRTHSITWNDCAVGNFGYMPKEIWEDPGMPEIIMFYDFGDVYWHDGVRMSARDIMFSFHAQATSILPWLGNPLAEDSGLASSNYSEDQWLFIQKVWESEDCTRAALKFTLQKPFYSAFESFASSYILPYHIWGSEISNQTMNNTMIWCDPGYNGSDDRSWKSYFAAKWSNPSPVGSGPFRWSGATPSAVTLVPWEKHFYRPGFRYYSYDGGIAPQPKVDKLLLRIYNSEQQALMDLEYDRLDMIAWDVPLSVINRFSENIDIRFRLLRSTSEVYLASNLGRRSFGYVREYVNGVPVDTDYGKPLRKALTHVIDTGTINAMVNPLASNASLLAAYIAWQNTSAPIYSFDPQEAARILSNAGYLLDDPARLPGDGNWWSNPDGSPIGSSVGGKIEILMPESDYDSDMFRVGTLIATQMRSVGINAATVPLGIDMLLERYAAKDYDLLITAQSFSEMFRSRPEIHFFGAYHSDNMVSGPNLCGYRNGTFDGKVNLAMATAGAALEQQYVRDIMASIAYDVPTLTLYHESNTEVYRVSNFDGMVDDGSGSLLNPVSMASARYMGKMVLKAGFIGLPLTVLSNNTVSLRVKVTDQNSNTVAGATVTLAATAGKIGLLTGTTDEFGTFITNYTAPYVQMNESFNNWLAVTITIKSATMEGYGHASESQATVTVFPDRLRTMTVWAISVQDVISDTDSLGNPGFTLIEVYVVDQGNVPVSGATVTLRTGGTNLTAAEPTAWTDSSGSAIFKLTASPVSAEQSIQVTINATKTGFKNASAELTITVLPYDEGLAEVPPEGFPTVPAAVALVVIAAAGALYFNRRRKHPKI
ncbi:MAG: ABC transporter substrate-binding protein [Thermoplasmata archaeon]|nr:ABC transporter substrate-binding protein [Thermoplasmata archaeon]